ncbi:MAG: hypothetical protein AAGF12_02840 [Myxococcota bacterium]
MRIFSLLLTLVVVSGCSATTNEEVVSKDEARNLAGGADLGRDFCAEYRWYGDGICDSFCPMADTEDCGAIRNIDGEGPTVCVGVRGNGQLITAHFASLARIIEHHGLISGVAGGSSGSITSFLLESIQMHPAVRCEGCSNEEQAARAALLFKSFQGYFGELARSDEGLAIQQAAGIYGEVQAGGIESLLDSDPSQGVAALQTILESETFAGLINPEVIALLESSPDPVFHARDIVQALASAAEFNADDPVIFVRPGVISFETFADRIGRVGSFYAGYAPADAAAMDQFLADCASESRGLTWAEAAALPASNGRCGDTFGALVREFRTELLEDEAAYRSRIHDPVGGELHALISTSVLEGAAIEEWEEARWLYEEAAEFDFDVDFNDVKFGYWGAEEDLARVAANSYGFGDDKTRRFTSLGEANWRVPLSFSPAEPGLTRALELPDGRVSAGGWSDLHPTLVLRNMGCEQVFYLTRQGSGGGFATDVARLLGMSPDQHFELYDLENRWSAYAISVAEADGVWCTDWNAQNATDLMSVENDAYHAPFEARDPRLLEGGYENTSTSLGLPGCTAGVSR